MDVQPSVARREPGRPTHCGPCAAVPLPAAKQDLRHRTASGWVALQLEQEQAQGHVAMPAWPAAGCLAEEHLGFHPLRDGGTARAGPEAKPIGGTSGQVIRSRPSPAGTPGSMPAVHSAVSFGSNWAEQAMHMIQPWMKSSAAPAPGCADRANPRRRCSSLPSANRSLFRTRLSGIRSSGRKTRCSRPLRL